MSSPLGVRRLSAAINIYFWGGLLVEAVGAGKGLSDQQFAVAERLDVAVRYATKGVRLLQDQRGRVIGVTVQGPEGFADLHAQGGHSRLWRV